MNTRPENEDLSIVFGTKCDWRAANEKLKSEPIGSFLIRESSIEGLITLSYVAAKPGTNQTEVKNQRLGLTGGAEGLTWWYVTADAIQAKAFAATAKKAFEHIRDNPEGGLDNLIRALKESGYVKTELIVLPEDKECSSNYNCYRRNEYDTRVVASPETPKKGYGPDGE